MKNIGQTWAIAALVIVLGAFGMSLSSIGDHLASECAKQEIASAGQKIPFRGSGRVGKDPKVS